MIPDELSGGPHFADFCANYIRHTKGRWAGQPLIFEDWQREFWWEALELDPTTGLRVYSEVGLGLPRKNGKSAMASAMGLYLLVADGEAEPEIYAAAAARQQATIVMGQSRRMAMQSQRLLDYVKVYRYLIECPRNGGIMRTVSSDAGLQHGLNSSGNIVDELHAHESGDLYTALVTGTGARLQPLTLWISTAGVAGEGILGQIYNSMFSGVGELEVRGSLRIYRNKPAGTLIYWYGAPDDADIEDPAVWRSCNPASWMQDLKVLTKEFNSMKSKGELLQFRRLHANQMVNVEEAWLPVGAWEACLDTESFLDPALPVGIGIDKGQTSDSSAIVVAQRQGDRVVLRLKIFPPEPGTGRVSTEAMRQYLRQQRETYPRPQMRNPKTRIPIRGPAAAFDRWAFSESAEMLEADGLNMVDFPQWASTMGPASTQMYELITTRRISHDGDPVLAEHIRNTTAVLTERGMKVAKPKKPDARKNDAAIAAVMAVAMAMQEAPAPLKAAQQAVGF